MKLCLNRVHYPVTTLGYGRRVGLWTQGCSIRCAGCISRDTWEEEKDRAIEVADLVDALDTWLAKADGVTISGGEPLDQAEAICELLGRLSARFGGDILLYSGHRYETIFGRFPEIVSQVDVLISEPYVQSAGATLELRGSDNQRVFLLSELAHSRYPADLDRRPRPPIGKLDVVVDGRNVWMAGIPKTGEMARVRRMLARHGLSCHTSDQQPVGT